jgi:hypothetical protein
MDGSGGYHPVEDFNVEMKPPPPPPPQKSHPARPYDSSVSVEYQDRQNFETVTATTTHHEGMDASTNVALLRTPGDRRENTSTNLLSQLLMNSMASSSSSSLPAGTSSSFRSDDKNASTNPVLSLVRSILQRMINDVQMQSTICQFLQNVSLEQIQQYMQLFGVSHLVTLPTQYVEPVINFCHTMTLVRLQRMIFLTQCMNYGRQILQRIIQILQKYHTIILWYWVQVWIRSSVVPTTTTSFPNQRQHRVRSS